MTPRQLDPTACDIRHQGVKWSIAKWFVLPLLGVVISANAWFYQAYAAEVRDQDVRIQQNTQNIAVSRAEYKAIREQLNRIEKYMGGRACAPTEERTLER